MAQYIDKDALVAQASIEITSCRLAAQEGILTEFGKGKLEGLEGIVDFLNTLEVKEVDLEKALSNLDKDIKEFVTTEEFENESATAGHYWAIAKHAFLLGLNCGKVC